MNIRLHLATAALALSLASCVYNPPRPVGPAPGVSLDKPASGDLSARETRYLEQEVTQAPAGQPAPSGTAADPNAPAPSADPSAVQTPSGTTPPPAPTATEPPKEAATPPAPSGSATPSAPAPAPAATELPYGVPVPGKKGFVYSPYDKSAGFVDVRDIGPGTKVRCPYTGKIFRVP